MTYEEKITRLRAARNTLHKLEHIGILENNLSIEQITAIRIAEFALDELCKSKDVQPVIHSRWIPTGDGTYNAYCENCGQERGSKSWSKNGR